MPETIIVTIRAQGGFCRDLELPAAVRLEQLYPRLLDVLRRLDGSTFSRWNSLLLEKEEGILLDLSAVLSDYGICTGCYLTAIEGEADNGYE